MGYESNISMASSSLSKAVESLRLHSINSSALIIYIILHRSNLIMEKKELIELMRDFDQFVQLSLQKKDSSELAQQQQETRAQNYLTTMEKRLKLIPISQQQKFQNLLKPMKQLKSFVSVREFMQKLGSGTMCQRQNKNRMSCQQEKIKLQYQTLRGGYYLQKIEQHLRRKQFKRKASHVPCFLTELDGNPLEHSEFKNWAQSTLSKISPKCETFFKKLAEQDLKNSEEGQNRVSEQQDCLIEEHKQNYAEQFKVVPRIREVGDQQYEQFAKISNLLTGRLKKLLKSNCSPRSTICSQPQKSNFVNKNSHKNSSRNTLRVIHQNIPFQLHSKRGQPKRVQTANNIHRDELNSWRQSVNSKLKLILNHEYKPKAHMDILIDNLE